MLYLSVALLAMTTSSHDIDRKLTSLDARLETKVAEKHVKAQQVSRFSFAPRHRPPLAPARTLTPTAQLDAAVYVARVRSPPPQIAEIGPGAGGDKNKKTQNIATNSMMVPSFPQWSEDYKDGQNIQSCGLEDVTPKGVTFTDGSNNCRPGAGTDGYISSTIGTWTMGFNGDSTANIAQAPRKTGLPARASPDDFGSFFSYTATTTADKPKLAFVRVVGRDCLSYNVDCICSDD